MRLLTNGKGRNTLPFNNNTINIFPEKNVKLLLEKQPLSVMQNAALLILCSWLKVLSFEMLCNQRNPSIYSHAPRRISYPYIYIPI